MSNRKKKSLTRTIFIVAPQSDDIVPDGKRSKQSKLTRITKRSLIHSTIHGCHCTAGLQISQELNVCWLFAKQQTKNESSVIGV